MRRPRYMLPSPHDTSLIVHIKKINNFFFFIYKNYTTIQLSTTSNNDEEDYII